MSAIPGSALDRVRILVADEHRAMRALSRSMLGSIGFANVDAAADGDEAYRKFMAQPASIVLTEVHMEPVDGLALMKRIRTEPTSPNPFVPIVVLSGDAERNTVLQARDAGANAFLLKPVSIDTLFTHIKTIIAEPRDFVNAANYFGPDRRRHATVRRQQDRRYAPE